MFLSLIMSEYAGWEQQAGQVGLSVWSDIDDVIDRVFVTHTLLGTGDDGMVANCLFIVTAVASIVRPETKTPPKAPRLQVLRTGVECWLISHNPLYIAEIIDC